jgi:hypothetical protein
VFSFIVIALLIGFTTNHQRIISMWLLFVEHALIAIERQVVAEKQSETKKKIALSQAEKNAQVSLILMEQKLMEKDSIRRKEAIENEMFVAREKAQTDAGFYRSLTFLVSLMLSCAFVLTCNFIEVI